MILIDLHYSTQFEEYNIFLQDALKSKETLSEWIIYYEMHIHSGSLQFYLYSRSEDKCFVKSLVEKTYNSQTKTCDDFPLTNNWKEQLPSNVGRGNSIFGIVWSNNDVVKRSLFVKVNTPFLIESNEKLGERLSSLMM